MPKGMSRSNGSGGENIQHFSHMRLRIVGSGILRSTIYSLDDIRSQALPNYTMAATTRIEPTILTNFVEQRARIKYYITDVNEENPTDWFRLTRVVIFMKDFGSEYPM